MRHEKKYHFVIKDYDSLFYSSNGKALPLGDNINIGVTAKKKQSIEYLQELFQDGNVDLSFVASCQCGYLTGNYHIGTKCPRPDCGTEVRTRFARDLQYAAWMEIPDYAPPVLHNKAYMVLKNWLGTTEGKKTIDVLLNPSLPMPKVFQKAGLGQGMAYFHANYDNIMRFFLERYAPTRATAQAKEIPRFYQSAGNKVFVRHLPMLGQSLNMLTSRGTMNFTDDCVEHYIAAMVELNQMEYKYKHMRVDETFVDQKIYDITVAYTNYGNMIMEGKLLQKKGLVRKAVLGARLFYTHRGVIVPITGYHQPDELHIPWRMAVNMLKLPIINILMNRMGMEMVEAYDLHMTAYNKVIPEVKEAIDILIHEIKAKGYPGLPYLI